MTGRPQSSPLQFRCCEAHSGPCHLAPFQWRTTTRAIGAGCDRRAPRPHHPAAAVFGSADLPDCVHRQSVRTRIIARSSSGRASYFSRLDRLPSRRFDPAGKNPAVGDSACVSNVDPFTTAAAFRGSGRRAERQNARPASSRAAQQA